MKKILFAIGALALGLTATAPAHADFAIAKFNGGYCRIWADTVMAPPGRNVRLVCVGIPPLLPPADITNRSTQAKPRRRSTPVLARVSHDFHPAGLTVSSQVPPAPAGRGGCGSISSATPSVLLFVDYRWSSSNSRFRVSRSNRLSRTSPRRLIQQKLQNSFVMQMSS
jgi:hypothetical protein